MPGISALTNALGSEGIVVIAQDPVLVVVHVDDQVHGLGAVSLGVQLECICDVKEKIRSAVSLSRGDLRNWTERDNWDLKKKNLPKTTFW